MKKCVIVAASTGKNLELANSLLKLVKELGGDGEVLNIVELNLPLFTSEEEEKGIPNSAKISAKKLKDADFHIYIAPEYNGSMPPTFVNFISWASRSGDDWREVFNGKGALIATHSGGGGAHVLMAMRQQLAFIGMNVLGRQLLTNYGKALNNDSAIECLKMLL